MLGKRGASPLVVTIVLIALAVALGAAIMNWGSAAVGVEMGCEGAKLEVQRAFGQDMVCFSESSNKLRVVLKNAGSSTINSVVYRRTLPNFRSSDLILDSSTIKPGFVYDVNISYVLEDNAQLEFIPTVVVGEEPQRCSDKIILIESVALCKEQ